GSSVGGPRPVRTQLGSPGGEQPALLDPGADCAGADSTYRELFGRGGGRAAGVGWIGGVHQMAERRHGGRAQDLWGAYRGGGRGTRGNDRRRGPECEPGARRARAARDGHVRIGRAETPILAPTVVRAN